MLSAPIPWEFEPSLSSSSFRALLARQIPEFLIMLPPFGQRIVVIHSEEVWALSTFDFFVAESRISNKGTLTSKYNEPYFTGQIAFESTFSILSRKPFVIDMWQDLLSELDGEGYEVTDRRYRYLAFVDYLGTSELYQHAIDYADLIVGRRNELEHAVQILLQPFIAKNQIEVGLFSDTVLVAGSSLADVLHCSSVLMKFVLNKTINRASRTDYRLLRGGLAKGIELRTSYLRPDPKVHVIPFFDSSLAFSYELEGIRRGSRLFLSATVNSDELGALSRFVFPWKYISGVGRPTVGIHEFLWPGYVYKDNPTELSHLLLQAFNLWRSHVAEGRPTQQEYKATLYHFDETIKCILRSFISLTDTPHFKEAIDIWMSTILPRDEDRMEDCDIRHLWGFWFQALLVVCAANRITEFATAIARTKRELVRRSYLDKFMAEAEYPDYELLRELFKKPAWRDT